MFEEAAIARKDSSVSSTRTESISIRSRRGSSTPQSPSVGFGNYAKRRRRRRKEKLVHSSSFFALILDIIVFI